MTYGAMGRQPLSLPNGPVIFRELRASGFWVTAWYQRASAAQITEMFGRLAGLFKQGALDTFVEQRYPLEQVLDAVAHAQREGKKGKILLEL